MFGRNGGRKSTVAQAASSVRSVVSGATVPVVGFVDPLAKDEKMRQRLTAALAAGVAARRRAQRQAGLRGLATRLASDRVLRAQLAVALAELQAAQKRAKKVHSHRLRNTLLLVTGAGIGVAAAIAARDAMADGGGSSGSSNESGRWSPGPAGSGDAAAFDVAVTPGPDGTRL